MLPNILSHFESIGDNCEFGLLQRQFGIEYSNIFRWSVSFSIDAVIRALDMRFEGLFQYENLLPRGGGDMVNDIGCDIAFHTDMISEFDGTDWVFTHVDEQRHNIYLRELKKTRHLCNKMLDVIRSANKILIYKCNQPIMISQEERLWRSIRSIGKAKLLIVSAADEDHPADRVVQREKDLYRGYISSFAPYERADLYSVGSWATLVDATMALDSRFLQRNSLKATDNKFSICELAELGLTTEIEIEKIEQVDIGDYFDRYADIESHSEGNILWGIKHLLHHGYFEGRVWRRLGETIDTYQNAAEQIDYLYRHNQFDQLQPFLIENLEQLKFSIRSFIIAVSKCNGDVVAKCYEGVRDLSKFAVFAEQFPSWLIAFFGTQAHTDFIPFIKSAIDKGIVSSWAPEVIHNAFRTQLKGLPEYQKELLALATHFRLNGMSLIPPLELLSLGMNCEVAKNIELWRQFEEADEVVDQFEQATLAGSNFFDWNISSMWSVSSCIQNDFKDVLLRENIRVREEKIGTFNYVDDIGTGIRFHHLFTRENDLTTQAIVDAEYTVKKSKVDYLIDKFVGGYKVERTVFYLRRGNDTITELITLCHAIEARRENRPFFLVSIRSDEAAFSSGEVNRLIIVHMAYTDEWSGNWDQWKDLFLTLRNYAYPSTIITASKSDDLQSLTVAAMQAAARKLTAFRS